MAEYDDSLLEESSMLDPESTSNMNDYSNMRSSLEEGSYIEEDPLAQDGRVMEEEDDEFSEDESEERHEGEFTSETQGNNLTISTEFEPIDEDAHYVEEDDSDEDEEELDDPRAREARMLYIKKQKYIEKYADELKKRESIYSKHRKAQKRLAEIFRVTKGAERFANSAPSSEVEERYAKYVAEHKELRDEMEELRRKNAIQLNEMRIRLEERETNASELQNSFREFKRSMALSAVDSRTGKKIPPNSIDQYIDRDLQKDDNIRDIRTTFIELKNTKDSLEKLIKSREEFSEGLHLMDYEQLKMENSTLMEKLREKRDNLKKSREKQTTTVHILTHVKEKLQYVQTENSELQKKLDKLNINLTEYKDMLTRIKKERDMLKKQNMEMREKEPLVGSDSLLLDYQSRKDELEMLKDQVMELKNTYNRLILKTKSYNKQTEAFEKRSAPKVNTYTLPDLHRQ